MILLRDPPAPASEREAEALFREARRRRRQRWIVAAVVISLVVTGAAVVAEGMGGSGSSGRSGAHRFPPSAAGTSIHQRTGTTPNVPVLNDAYANQMGVLGGGPTGLAVGWAIGSFSRIYLTTDAGKAWRDITPPLLPGQVDAGFGSVAAASANDLWVPVDGSSMGEGIDRSTDGGRTWHFSVLPGCPQRCGATISMSVVNAKQGYALAGFPDTGPAWLFRTDNGGVTWVRVSEPASFGATTTIRFAGVENGWAETSPADTERVVDSRRVFHTTDGGQTWHVVAGLPSTNSYQLPVTFGSETADVLGVGRYHGISRAEIFVTHDAGRTWERHLLPGGFNLHTYGGAPVSYASVPFSATTPSRWAVFIGPGLYTTSDSGQHWQRLVPNPSWWGPGALLQMHFGSQREAWAISASSSCRSTATVRSCIVNLPMLYATSNGGRTWRPLPISRTASS